MSDRWPPLVPELTCSNLSRAVAFYVDGVGATVQFERPGFAYLALGNAHLMLEQAPGGWETGLLEYPYGRGINLQIETDDVDAVLDRLTAMGVQPFRPIGVAWYRQGNVEHGQREFLVQDPDGYLLRFVTVIGERAVAA